MLARAEAWIAAARLRGCPLAPALADMTGSLAAATLRLTTRRFTGADFESLTLATISDDQGLLRSVTLIGLPAGLRPVLGVDLIGFGGALSLVAVDLSPTDRGVWERTAAAALQRLHAAVDEHVTPRKWPGFAHEVFSPRALIAGVRRGAEAPVLAAIADFVAGLPADDDEQADPGRLAQAREQARAWRRAELANRKEHDALTRIFGAARAEAYLELLFGAPS